MDMSQLQGLNLQETKEAILMLAHLADVKMVRYSEPRNYHEKGLWIHWKGLRDGLFELVTRQVGVLEATEMQYHCEMGKDK